MSDITPRSLQQVARYLCESFGIDMDADDIVLFIGSDAADSNAQAIKEWINAQDKLPTYSRRALAIELRDRLQDVLFDLESTLRSTP